VGSADTVSRIEPAGQRRRLQRPPSRVRFVDFDHPWGVLCGERVELPRLSQFYLPDR